MKTFIVEIDNKPNLQFTGSLIAYVESTHNNAAEHYSGQVGRWAELSLYKTAAGKYVCHQVGRTCFQGETDRYSGLACETIEQVKEFFGYRWLAKELYEKANIDASINID